MLPPGERRARRAGRNRRAKDAKMSTMSKDATPSRWSPVVVDAADIVIPAKAGARDGREAAVPRGEAWIPAFAGMTVT
jgi:hypothetical protein